MCVQNKSTNNRMQYEFIIYMKQFSIATAQNRTWAMWPSPTWRLNRRTDYACTQGRLTSHQSHNWEKKQENALFSEEGKEKWRHHSDTETHEVSLNSCRMENLIQNPRKWQWQPGKQSGSRMGAGNAWETGEARKRKRERVREILCLGNKQSEV